MSLRCITPAHRGIWIALWLYPLAASAWPAALDLGTQTKRVDLAPYWSYQVASDRRALLPALGSEFRPLHQATDLPHGAEASIWFKLELHNSSSFATSRLLEIDDPLVGAAELIVVQDRSGLSRQRSGLRVPASERSIRLPQPVFTIRLLPNSRATVYLFVQSRNGMDFATTLWTPEAFFYRQEIYTWIFGIGLGVITVMAVYNLLVSFMAKELMFRRFATLLACVATTHLIVQGWGGTYLWGEWPMLTRVLIGPMVGLCFIALLSFARHFLAIHDSAWLNRVVALTMAFNAVMIGVLSAEPDGYLFNLLILGNLPACIVLTIHAGNLAKARQAAGGQFLLTLTPLFAAIVLLAANRSLGLGYSTAFIQSGVLLGNAAVAAGFAVVLADRIRRSTMAHESAHEELLRAEQHVRESQSKIAAANRDNQAKSAFLATMSHEIRTPMNGILGMAELLTQTDLSQQQHYYVATLKRAGQALMDILNDVLDYSKAEAGRMELERVDVDLVELLDDTITLYRDALNQKGLRCYLLVQPNVPERIVGDPTRLKQVLGNLLSNAIKFTNDGEIRLQVSSRDPGYLTFAIADEGIGIEPSALPALFERFEQADSSINRKYGGTGLGLAISKRLVELMGGHITAASNPEQGATFTFTIAHQHCEPTVAKTTVGKLWLLSTDDTLAQVVELAVARWGGELRRLSSLDDPTLAQLTASDRLLVDDDMTPETAAQLIPLDSVAVTLLALREALVAPTETKAPGLQPVHTDKPLTDLDVLVAEDNTTNRLVVGKILDNWGANVRFAENGLEARDLYDACHAEIDLVLMDCEMPELDGYAATEAIRELEAAGAWRQVPIIALTAHVMPEFRRRAQLVGMSDYVTKPLDRSKLLSAIMGATEPRQKSARH